MSQLCLFCGSFNPPGMHHRTIAETLASCFDRVIVFPCGPRPDKRISDALPPVVRSTLVVLAFQDMPGIEIDLSDMEENEFTRTHELDARFANQHEVWHAIPIEQTLKGKDGKSPIQRDWRNGEEIWQRLRYAIFHQPGTAINHADLPPNHQLIEVPHTGRSKDLRSRLINGEPCENEIPSRVLSHIRRYGFYEFSAPRFEAKVNSLGSKFGMHTADFNPTAQEWKSKLSGTESESNPDAIMVIGGDGTMLSAIRKHWERRRPFLGLNAGTLGFLMSESTELLETVEDAWRVRFGLIVRRLPMIRVRMQKRDGTWIEELAFNDAWVERASAQTAWLRVLVDGEVKIPKLVADGALVSTAAGSTAYALSMGAAPLLADTPAWMVVGSNVMRPLGWKSALLPIQSTLRIEALETHRRPLKGFLPSQTVEDVMVMEARLSQTAEVELAFSSRHDMARKISDLQFGTVREI